VKRRGAIKEEAHPDNEEQYSEEKEDEQNTVQKSES
jgi:hypothetical protein